MSGGLRHFSSISGFQPCPISEVFQALEGVKKPAGGLDRLNACPTNSTPGLVKVSEFNEFSEFSVGRAIPPASSLASEVFIPISDKLQGIPDELRGGPEAYGIQD